jgi:hypothetical protein
MGFAASDDAIKAIQWAQDTGYRSKDLVTQLANAFQPLAEKYLKTENADKSISLGEHHILQRLLKKKKVKLYIDDLDRGWDATEHDKKRLAALIRPTG